MKKLFIVILFYGAYTQATIGDVLQKAGETFAEEVATVGDLVETAVVGKPEPIYVVAGSLYVTNISTEPVSITLDSGGSLYKENEMESFDISPGKTVTLSPNLLKTTVVYVVKNSEKSEPTTLPVARKIELTWDGRTFHIR